MYVCYSLNRSKAVIDTQLLGILGHLLLRRQALLSGVGLIGRGDRLDPTLNLLSRTVVDIEGQLVVQIAELMDAGAVGPGNVLDILSQNFAVGVVGTGGSASAMPSRPPSCAIAAQTPVRRSVKPFSFASSVFM